MSSTNRSKTERDPLERHDTPAWAVDRLIDWLALHVPLAELERWAEPAVGAGNIRNAVDAYYTRCGLVPPSWWLNDLSPRVEGALASDYTERDEADLICDNAADVAITNPPFSKALPFVLRMRLQAQFTAVLLRVNWLEGASTEEPERATLLRAHPPAVLVLPQRCAFTYGGPAEFGTYGDSKTDSCAYAWLVWGIPECAGTWALLGDTSRDERLPKRERKPKATQLAMDDGAPTRPLKVFFGEDYIAIAADPGHIGNEEPTL